MLIVHINSTPGTAIHSGYRTADNTGVFITIAVHLALMQLVVGGIYFEIEGYWRGHCFLMDTFMYRHCCKIEL